MRVFMAQLGCKLYETARAVQLKWGSVHASRLSGSSGLLAQWAV